MQKDPLMGIQIPDPTEMAKELTSVQPIPHKVFRDVQAYLDEGARKEREMKVPAPLNYTSLPALEPQEIRAPGGIIFKLRDRYKKPWTTRLIIWIARQLKATLHDQNPKV